MKSLKYITIAGLTLLILGLNSCSPEFLDRKPTTAVSNDEALTNVTNVQSATVGLMLYFATSGYTGRNLPVIGDLITDNVTTKAGNSGHLLDIEMWNISSSLGEIETFWGGSYQIVSAAAKVVQACEKLREGANSDNQKTLDRCKAAALTVKVFAEYILTQYYCLPYSAAGSSAPFSVGSPEDMNGIILVPKNRPFAAENAIDKNSTLEIATLAATYEHMHEELEDAILAFNNSAKDYQTNNAAYFPTLCMAYTLQARLYLEQGYYDAANFEKAYEAAKNALANLPASAEKDGKLVGDAQKFLEQYRSISGPTQEDILTVNFTASDNLSANSINNMFGSYGARVSSSVTSLIDKNDIRKIIYLNKNEDDKLEIFSSCGKYPNQDQINNVPVLRVPELYLIQAEARANTSNGDVDNEDYKKAMLATLGVRDTSINKIQDENERYAKLKEVYFKNPEKSNEALSYVLDERRREFAGEGHRWFDLRRTKSLLTHKAGGDYRISFTDYPIYAFAFPIPESETNTGAWHDGGKNGKCLGQGSRGQNECWKQNGDGWMPTYILPTDEGSDYMHD